MKFFKIVISSMLSILGIFLFFPKSGAMACTSFILDADDGAAVYGRTMEWGAFELHSRLVVIPQGHEFVGQTPDGKPGLCWQARFGAVAIDVIKKDIFADGINEKGLVIGLLWLPGFTEFQPYDPAQVF